MVGGTANFNIDSSSLAEIMEDQIDAPSGEDSKNITKRKKKNK